MVLKSVWEPNKALRYASPVRKCTFSLIPSNSDSPWKMVQNASIISQKSCFKPENGRVLFWSPYLRRVVNFLQNFAGLTPKSHEIAHGSAPVHPKNSPGPRNEVPDRFGEGRFFWKISKNHFFGRCFFGADNSLHLKLLIANKTDSAKK